MVSGLHLEVVSKNKSYHLQTRITTEIGTKCQKSVPSFISFHALWHYILSILQGYFEVYLMSKSDVHCIKKNYIIFNLYNHLLLLLIE